MKISFLAFVVFFSISTCACAVKNSLARENVEMNIDDCNQGFCITMRFVNTYDRPLCIKNTYFPYDGILDENAFDIHHASSKERVKYKLIEPSTVTTDKYAVLVRLLAPGAIATTTINIMDFYELKKGEKSLLSR